VPALNTLRRTVLIAGLISLASVMTAVPATADTGHGGNSQGSGGENGQTLSAGVSTISFDTSKNGSGGSSGAMTASGDWTPPACWFEPTYTPKQFAAENQSVWSSPSVGNDWANGQKDKYANGKPYKNFNIGKKGYWWTGVPNPSMLADPASLKCIDAGPMWVPQGATPAVPNPVTPQVLADLAYQQIRVPNTKVTLSPNGKQTVNLNTWAWLDRATFKPVSVTARLRRLNISATTTATPVSLHLEPGTQDADVHPASGDCPIVGGRIGTPYSAKDGNSTPPCGMTYLRATSGGAAYQFKATITWKVAWTGVPDGGGALPDGTFGTSTAVTVQEVQTVVR
jgi:enoyl reductase